MKSLADFKRLAVTGALFERSFPNNVRVSDGKTLPPSLRKVSHVQSNAVAFVEPHEEDGQQRSWFYFPKTKRLRFDDGVMTLLYDDGTPCLTLKHVGSS